MVRPIELAHVVALSRTLPLPVGPYRCANDDAVTKHAGLPSCIPADPAAPRQQSRTFAEEPSTYSSRSDCSGGGQNTVMDVSGPVNEPLCNGSATPAACGLSAGAPPFQPPPPAGRKQRAEEAAAEKQPQPQKHRVVSAAAAARGRRAKSRTNVNCNLWAKAVSAGVIPDKRSSHTATMVGDTMYVFGGFGAGAWYNSVSVLDTVTMTWQKRNAKGDVPCPRYAHVAAQDGNKMYIFGGFGTAQFGNISRNLRRPASATRAPETYLNDVYAFDVTTLEWSRVNEMLDGLPPCPRAACAASFDRRSRIWYIQGGNAGERRLDDLHALNLATQQWRQIEMTTVSSGGGGCGGPGPRAGHTMTLVGDSLHLFGGCEHSALDVPEMGPDLFNDHYVIPVSALL